MKGRGSLAIGLGGGKNEDKWWCETPCKVDWRPKTDDLWTLLSISKNKNSQANQLHLVGGILGTNDWRPWKTESALEAEGMKLSCDEVGNNDCLLLGNTDNLLCWEFEKLNLDFVDFIAEGG